jgi:hypothetical protein
MAERDSTSRKPFEYMEFPWGDLITGSKEELQLCGLGVDMAFPGEPGAPKRKLTVIDPRGFKAEITAPSYNCTGVYSAFIRFPDRTTEDEENEHQIAPGVTVNHYVGGNAYRGSSADLVAAGIVPEGRFPGLPGMQKIRLRVLPDGTIPNKLPNANYDRSEPPGTRLITKMGKDRFWVMVTIDELASESRREASLHARQAWEARMAAMPRPPRIDGALRAVSDRAAAERRAQLRVVWSKPRFVPGFNPMPPGPFAA